MEEKILKLVPNDMEIVKPVSGELNNDQLKRSFRNLLKFSAFPTLAFLGGLREGLNIQQAFTLSLIPALLNVLIDVITKWNDSTPYLRDIEK